MKFQFMIEGTSDLLTHNPIGMFTSSGKPGRAQAPASAEEEAEIACYRLSDGGCGLPALAVRGALLAAASDYKVPKKRYSMAKVLSGCEIAPMEYLPLTRNGAPITDYGIDSRRAVNRTTKGAIIVHRPKYAAGWQVSFDLIFDDKVFAMAESEVRELLVEMLNDAGRRIGIGAFRPANKGWFGRFKVI